MPTIDSSIVATGGAVLLNIATSAGVDPVSGTITLNRYTGSLTNTPVQLYQGPITPVYIDAGDGLPNYLNFATTYYYSVIDAGGTATTGAIVPSAEVTVYNNYLDELLFRLFSAGISALAVPPAFSRIRVLQAMPLTLSSELIPFIVMNLDLEQQEFIQIGQSIDTSFTNTFIQPVILRRRYSLSTLTFNARERDFYKDATIAVLYSMLPALSEIGSDININFQAAQSQVTSNAAMPGFYEAHIMLDFEGTFNIITTTNFGLISTINPIVSGSTVSGVIQFIGFGV